MTDADGVDAICSALSIGYRHIDTAQTYGTEAAVGAALARSGLERDEVFVTTKIADTNFGRVAESLCESLGRLGLDQVDLTLIHWPAPGNMPPVSSYVCELARAQEDGLSRLIGVSNFTRRQVDAAIAAVGDGRIATNQVEIHPYLQNRVLAKHCAERGIPLTAYIPVARDEVSADPVMRAIAARHGATPPQVSLAFLLARGHIVIPKSSNPVRQRENLDAGALRLTEEDMAEIAALDRGHRFVDPTKAPAWD